MNPPDDRTDSTQLQAALLEYAEAPGKYQLSLRQPALLFGSIRQVLQLAAGRSAGGGEQPENKTVMEAAAFFIRAALLYPGASHYAVMGLPTRTEPVELKERYRLLMRLIHPDFAEAHAQTWPGDAAVRVNRANEVLSSPVLRAEYDEQLAGAGTQRPPVAPKMDTRAPAHVQPEETASWRFNRAAVWVLATCGGVVVVASLIPWQGPEQLVQKSDAPVTLTAGRPQAHPPATQTVAVAALPAEPPLVLPSPRPMAAPAPVHAPAAVHVPAIAPTPTHDPAPPSAPVRMLAALPAAAPVPTPIPAPVPAPRAEPPLQLRASTGVPAAGPQLVPATRNSPPAVVVAQAPRAAAVPPIAAQEAAKPIERQVEASAPAPVAVPLPVPVAMVREEAARPLPVSVQTRADPPPGPTGTEPTLNDAQPLLTLLLQSMEGGSGEQMLRLLESEARRAPAALALSRQYDQLVGRARPVRLSHVEFRSEAREGVLLVTGRVRLHAGDPTIGAHGERMSVRAEFVSRGGRVLLTGLSGGPD